MLGLLTPTLPTWVEAVERDLDRLLQDHAHCELKAALSALSLAARFGGEAPELVLPLLALANEETEHVAMVHERMRARDVTMSLPDRDDYVVMLLDVDRNFELIALSLKSTNIKVAKKLNGLIKTRQAPIYAGAYTLESSMTHTANVWPLAVKCRDLSAIGVIIAPNSPVNRKCLYNETLRRPVSRFALAVGA